MPRTTRSGIRSCAMDVATWPLSAEMIGTAAIPVTLHTKSQTAPLSPASGSPHASQSSIPDMPTSAVIIAEAMAADPAECATAPTAKAMSARKQKRRASKIMKLLSTIALHEYPAMACRVSVKGDLSPDHRLRRNLVALDRL